MKSTYTFLTLKFVVAALLLHYGPSSWGKVVGYGFSDAVLPPKNQELFYLGFEAGFEDAMGLGVAKKYVDLERVTDGSMLGAQKAVKALLARNSLALIAGFPTSHEAILAARVAKDQGILTIFAGAGHSDLATFGSTVFTSGESMESSVESLVEFWNGKYPSRAKGLIVSNPTSVFSKNQEDVMRTFIAKDEQNKLVVDYARLSGNLTLDPQDIVKLKRGVYTFLCLTSYADESAKLIEQLDSEGVDIPIITNSSWTTGDVDFIRRFLARRKSPIYSASLWSRETKEWKRFERKILRKYGKQPSSEVAYGFDVGVIVGLTLKRSGPQPTRKSILDAFYSNLCFSGTSSGEICFPRNGGHAKRVINIVQFTRNGFVEVN